MLLDMISACIDQTFDTIIAIVDPSDKCKTDCQKRLGKFLDSSVICFYIGIPNSSNSLHKRRIKKEKKEKVKTSTQTQKQKDKQGEFL